ncbi:RHS repeat domain-containing protein, partial [Sphingomonas sp. NCPPB 2930]
EALFVYEPGSFVPLATVQDGRTYWYQCDQIGAPLELTDEEGNIVWAADYKVWGEARVREIEGKATGTYGNDKARRPTGYGPGWNRQVGTDVPQEQQRHAIEQPFRFQGQQFDEETGLHYNRFRHYDPAIGRFVSQDPIGLEGGFNSFAYAVNPINWLDPLGLTKQEKKCPCDSECPPGTMNPQKIHFSQRTVSPNVGSYAKDMESGNWDWNKSGPLRIMMMNGNPVSYDNRRLLAARMSKTKCVPVSEVSSEENFPESKKHGDRNLKIVSTILATNRPYPTAE